MHKPTTLAIIIFLAASTSSTAGEDWSGFYAGVGISTTTTANHVDGHVTRNVTDMWTMFNIRDGVEQTQAWDGSAGALWNGGWLDSYDHHSSGNESDAAPYLFAGYAQQLGALLLGLEAGIDPSTRAPGTPDGPECVALQCVVMGSVSTLGPLVDLRALAGIIVTPQLALFGTLGASVARVSHADFFSISLATAIGGPQYTDSFRAQTDGYLLGYTVGLGAQVKATETLHFRVEGQVRDLAVLGYQNEVNVDAIHIPTNQGVALDLLTSGQTRFTTMDARISAIWTF